ncbi:MAG: hypothetical protein BWY28_01874 [bacterium ADurb.Bin236]|nr:MAG: hypothetical protein BWY28_01874 [bacterium ADurb.Bin236]
MGMYFGREKKCFGLKMGSRFRGNDGTGKGRMKTNRKWNGNAR